MEEILAIPTNDGHLIYGTLNYAEPQAKNIVVFVHGLTGNQHEHIHFNGAKFAVKKGFSAFRFNLYCGEEKARKFDETSLSIHAQDLNQVVEYLKQRGFQKIFVVGHSLGALTILLSDTKQIDGVILWDPTDDRKIRKEALNWISFDERIQSYIIDWGIKYIWGTKMYGEWSTFPDAEKILANLNKPLLLVIAGKGAYRERGKEYLRAAKKPKKLIVIEEGSHVFDEEGAEEKLFKATVQWCKKFSK